MLVFTEADAFGNKCQESLGTCSVESPVLNTNLATKADFYLIGDAISSFKGGWSTWL